MATVIFLTGIGLGVLVCYHRDLNTVDFMGIATAGLGGMLLSSYPMGLLGAGVFAAGATFALRSTFGSFLPTRKDHR